MPPCEQPRVRLPLKLIAAVLGVAALFATVSVRPAPAGASTTWQADAHWATASYQTFTKSTPSAATVSGWITSLANGASRQTVASEGARTIQFRGAMVDRAYRDLMGRTADASGRNAWIAYLATHQFKSLQIAFLSSPEWYQTYGRGNDPGYVDALYRYQLGRVPDLGGKQFWLAQLQTTSRASVAGSFVQSPESRLRRVQAAYSDVLHRSPDGVGLPYWSEQLNRIDDIDLYVVLAASTEFYRAAQSTAIPAGVTAPVVGPQGKAIAAALSQLGTAYKWAGAAPGGFDCSGLVQWSYAQAGVVLPRTTYDQAKVGRTVALSAIAPGDLVFTSSFGHVYLFIGNGQVVHAPQSGDVVKVVALPTSGVNAVVRVVG